METLELERYRVGNLPTLIYIPEFITEAEEARLLHHIYEGPESRWKSLKNRRLQNWGGVVHEKGLLPQDLPPWLTKITERIVERWELFPSAINHVLINEYSPHQGIMSHQDGPAYFPIATILSLESPVIIHFTPHSRLIEGEGTRSNAGLEISNGNGAAAKETDLLLSEATCKKDDGACSILLMPRSLFIFKDQAYSDYLHGINNSELLSLEKVVNKSECLKLEENCKGISVESVLSNGKKLSNSFHRTRRRVSLTCRLVPKVRRNLFRF